MPHRIKGSDDVADPVYPDNHANALPDFRGVGRRHVPPLKRQQRKRQDESAPNQVVNASGAEQRLHLRRDGMVRPAQVCFGSLSHNGERVTGESLHRAPRIMETPTVYQQVLGEDFNRLPPSLQRFHGCLPFSVEIRRICVKATSTMGASRQSSQRQQSDCPVVRALSPCPSGQAARVILIRTAPYLPSVRARPLAVTGGKQHERYQNFF